MSVYAKITELGWELPAVAVPLASYVPAKQTGNLVFTSGQLPIRDGQLLATGRVGEAVSEDQAVECARQCLLNALAAIHALTGDLNRVKSVVKVVGFVASAPGFTNQPVVINGCSDALLAIFGAIGQHARSAVGVQSLPKNAPVEIELIVEIA